MQRRIRVEDLADLGQHATVLVLRQGGQAGVGKQVILERLARQLVDMLDERVLDVAEEATG